MAIAVHTRSRAGRALGALAALLCAGGFAAAAGAQGSNAGGIYTCVDARGRTLTSDRPIPECLDRQQRELSSTGVVRRTIGPSLSERELAERDAREREQAEERRRQGDEVRRDRALLSRYANQAAHDTERAKALVQIDDVIAIATRRVTELQTERKALDTELEFYGNDKARAPDKLKRKYADNDADFSVQRRFIDGQLQEKQRINARFDAELARLRQLWAQQGAGR